jgi:hypothetical protein
MRWRTETMPACSGSWSALLTIFITDLRSCAWIIPIRCRSDRAGTPKICSTVVWAATRSNRPSPPDPTSRTREILNERYARLKGREAEACYLQREEGVMRWSQYRAPVNREGAALSSGALP